MVVEEVTESAMLASLLLAAVVFGDGNGVDCKAELAKQQAWVPKRLIFRLADKEHVPNIDALRTILSGQLHTKPEDLAIRSRLQNGRHLAHKLQRGDIRKEEIL